MSSSESSDDVGEVSTEMQPKLRNATLTVTMLTGVVDPPKCSNHGAVARTGNLPDKWRTVKSLVQKRLRGRQGEGTAQSFPPEKSSGPKVYVEIRLSDQIRRFSPVEVDSSSGEFSYDGLDGVQFNDNTLEQIFDEHLFVVLRSWDTQTSEWLDAAQIVVPVRTIDMTVTTDREFRSFVLEPVAENFRTDEMDKPSLVLSATLQSPFRPSLEFVARMLRGYGSTADSAVDTVSHQTKRVVPYVTSRPALISMGLITLLSLPVATVLGIVGFPLLVPIFFMCAVFASAGMFLVGTVWVGSRNGRPWVQLITKPVYDKLGRQDPEVLYPIGPRPSPARVIRSLAPTTMWPKLVLSLIVDFIGFSSYFVPVLGELMDLVWAPMSYLLIDAMYHNSSPWAGIIGGIEELLPFTDIIPTATLAWMREYIPVMIHRARSRVNGRPGLSRPQQVFHSNGDVGAGGVQYPSEVTTG